MGLAFPFLFLKRRKVGSEIQACVLGRSHWVPTFLSQEGVCVGTCFLSLQQEASLMGEGLEI